MKKEYSLNASPVQFFELADQIHNELSNIGRDVIAIHKPAFLILFAVGSEGSWTPDRRQELANYTGDTEIFICAESRALRDKGITIIVKDWDGETSKLVIEYRENDDWESANDTWQIFEERIKQKGWNLAPKSTAAFARAIVHDVRHLFEDSRGDSRREQIEAAKLLHGLGTQGKTPTDKQASKDGRAGTPQIGDTANVQTSSEISTNGNVTMDSIEIPINGTPHEFATLAIDFGDKQRAQNPDAPRYYISNVPKKEVARTRASAFILRSPETEIDHRALQDSNRLIIQCVQGGGLIDGKYEAENHLGELIALKTPDNETWLRVVADTENAAAFSQEWELLYQRMIRLGFVKRSGQDMAENTLTPKTIELEANGKGTDVGAAVEYLLSKPNNYECSVRWLNRREDREPHKKQTIELEYAASGFDDYRGQSFRRMLSQAHIESYPNPSGARITFTYPDEHARIYLPFWNDLYKLMGEWGIIAETAPAPTEKAKDQPTILQKKIIQAVQELKGDYVDPPDEMVAARIGLNSRGQPYTRETINRERSKLRKIKIEV